MPGRSQIPFVVVSATGDVLPDATVAITHRVGGAPATVYTSETSSTTLGTGTPQVSTQKDGRIPGWLPEGSYTIVITHASLPGSPWTRALDVAKGSGVGNLLDNVVTAAKVVANAVTTAKLATGSITTAKITDGVITEPKIADNAASSRAIATDAVTNPKLATDSIDQRTIANDAVTTTKIALLAVGSSEIADSAVIAGKYAAGAVTSAKIVDAEITTAALADAAVIAGKYGLNILKARNFANSVLPVGSIVAMGYDQLQSSKGWLRCDGSNYSPATWPALYAVIGLTYGSSGANFKVPNLVGRVPYGVNSGSSGIGALGTTESPAGALNVRGPKHLHYTNFTGSLGGGGHEHLYVQASDVKEGSNMVPASWQIQSKLYYGNTSLGTPDSGAHSHSIGGFWGDNSGMTNAPSFITMQYYIKAA